MKELYINYKQINEIVPYEDNPRLNDDAVPAVAKSIKQFGFKDPIIIDRNNIIIAGHTRLKAAKMLGLDKVPTVQADDLTDEQIKAFRLAHNKTAELAQWEEKLLFKELEQIKYIDMAELGFTDLLLNQDEMPEIVEDEIPEEIKTRCILGDIWQLGKHRLTCGDSTNIKTIAALLNGDKSEITFTSPPYNAAVSPADYKGGPQLKYKNSNDNLACKEYTAFLNKSVECFLQFSEYVFLNIQSLSNNKVSIIEVLETNKYNYADTIIWDKKTKRTGNT